MLRRLRPKPDAALPLLRRRTSYYLNAVEPQVRAFLRCIPLLLCTRFRRPALDTEPPGLVFAPRRRRWGRLCEQIDLPPPTAWYPIRPLIKSVVLAPTPEGGLEVLFVAQDELTPHEQLRVSGRIQAIEQMGRRYAPGVEVRLANGFELTPTLFAWAAVLAGDIPPIEEHRAFDWPDAFSRAPTPMLRCLMLLVKRDASSPVELLRKNLTPCHPMAFIARWSENPVARDVAALREETLSPAEIAGISHRLRAACLREIQTFPLEERRSLRQQIRTGLLGRRIPAVFRPHLERALRTKKWKEVQVEQGWQLEFEGLVLARAHSLEQLRASALLESEQLVPPGALWVRLSELMNNHPLPRALVVIEPGFLRHLVAFIPKSGRPRVWRVDAQALLQFVLNRHRSGIPVELMTSAGSEPTLVARATQLLTLQLGLEESVAIEIGTRVILMMSKARTRNLSIDRALRIPRLTLWLPEKAEVLGALRKPLATGLPTIQVVAFPDGDAHAALFALDAQGSIFRERVPLESVENTLQEYREVLSKTVPATLVSAAVHPTLVQLSGRRHQQQSMVLHVELSPRGDQALFEGERFGSGAALSWGSLAEAVLSHWPPGTWARVGVSQVDAPPNTPALMLLACRSRIIRRVNTHLVRIARFLQAA
jgi:hypothetical protein